MGLFGGFGHSVTSLAVISNKQKKRNLLLNRIHYYLTIYEITLCVSLNVNFRYNRDKKPAVTAVTVATGDSYGVVLNAKLL